MLTAANAVITLWQPILFPTPQQLQGFGADDVTGMADVDVLEDVMGVDGVLSFGFVWNSRNQTFTLQADSASNDFFDAINLQQQAAQTAYPLTGTIYLPAIKRTFNCVNGGLKRYKPMPDVKKRLMERTYSVVWNQVAIAPTT